MHSSQKQRPVWFTLRGGKAVHQPISSRLILLIILMSRVRRMESYRSSEFDEPQWLLDSKLAVYERQGNLKQGRVDSAQQDQCAVRGDERDDVIEKFDWEDGHTRIVLDS